MIIFHLYPKVLNLTIFKMKKKTHACNPYIVSNTLCFYILFNIFTKKNFHYDAFSRKLIHSDLLQMENTILSA